MPTDTAEPSNTAEPSGLTGYTYHVETDVWEGQVLPAVVRRTASGDADAVITSGDASPEECRIIAAILTAKGRGSFVAHSSKFFEDGDPRSGFESWVCDDEEGFGER